jgi:hypothetical protein
MFDPKSVTLGESLNCAGIQHRKLENWVSDLLKERTRNGLGI